MTMSGGGRTGAGVGGMGGGVGAGGVGVGVMIGADGVGEGREGEGRGWIFLKVAAWWMQRAKAAAAVKNRATLD